MQIQPSKAWDDPEWDDSDDDLIITQVIDNRAKAPKPMAIKKEKTTTEDHHRVAKSSAGQPRPSTNKAPKSGQVVFHIPYDEWEVDLDLADDLAEGLADD